MPVRLAALAVTVFAVAWTFAPAREFALLNWDDEAVIVRNAALDAPGVVTWAFTTTYMEHYQPLSWLVWAGLRQAYGAAPAAFHVANLLAHIACALLVYALMVALLRRASPPVPPAGREVAALAAALLFALHPLRVEVVAWVSALPYAVALALSLLAVLAWLRADGPAATRWWVAALLLYAASLLARPVALGLPLVLLTIDVAVFSRRARAGLDRVWPFAFVAMAAALVESVARTAGSIDAPWAYRVYAAATAPFVYVVRTLAPTGLTPLDALPDQPAGDPMLAALGLLALSALVGAAWHWRRRWPWLAAGAIAYLALLAPAAGLVVSGLQATADRYSYVPGVALTVAVTGAAVRWAGGHAGRQRLALAAAGVLVVVSAATARQALPPWSDSIALWTRVVALDPTGDVGLYNLATALAAAGRTEEAAGRYRDVLASRPDHALARANLDRIEAARLEREGKAAAARGDLAVAVQRYARAVALDEGRAHAHAGLGMALAGLGRAADAIPALRTAVRHGIGDPAVPNALAALLLDAGQSREARDVLEAALDAHRTDVDLAHNLARLLATTPEFARADAARALRLARAVVEATGSRDPRALDTLAAALAVNGRRRDAAETSARAAALAAKQGDDDLAVQITARGRAYRDPGP